MKKLFAVCLSLFVLLLSSCSAPVSVEETANTPVPTIQATQTVTESPTETPTEVPTPTPARTEKPEMEEFQKTATVEETLLYESDKVRITLTGLEYGNYSVTVNLLLENTSDVELSFLAGTMGFSRNSVNQFMISDGYMNSKITAGKKTYESIDFDYSSMQLLGITEIREMCIGVEVKDNDYKVVDQATLSFTTSAYDESYYDGNGFSESIQSASHQANMGYTVLYHDIEPCALQPGININSKTVIRNENGQNLLLLEATNETDDLYGIATTDIVLNGIMVCDLTWNSEMIYPEKTCVLSVMLDDVMDESIRNALGIQEFSEIELVLESRDAELNDTGAKAKIYVMIPEKESDSRAEGKEIYTGNDLIMNSFGIVKDSFEYSEDLHWILLVSNQGEQTLVLTDEYDSLSINGFMARYSMYSTTIPAKGCAVIDIQLWSSGLEDVNITSADEISEIEVKAKVMTANWKTLDTITLKDTIEH